LAKEKKKGENGKTESRTSFKKEERKRGTKESVTQQAEFSLSTTKNQRINDGGLIPKSKARQALCSEAGERGKGLTVLCGK